MPIFKQPPNRLQNLPREIAARQSGGCFYRENPPSSGHFRTFGPLPDDPDRHEFFAAIERVAQDIRDWLQEFRDRASQKALGKVFLAAVSPELRLDRERLRSDLQQRRYGVSPEFDRFDGTAGGFTKPRSPNADPFKVTGWYAATFFIATLLALPLSAGLLSFYRRAVVRSMRRRSHESVWPQAGAPDSAGGQGIEVLPISITSTVLRTRFFPPRGVACFAN